jgi:hypothetical protein
VLFNSVKGLEMYQEQPAVMPGKPIVGKIPRKSLQPEENGASCLYLTAHAARRLEERFGLKSLFTTPFSIHTYYCEADDVDRPVWAVPIAGGYVLGRWEESLRADVPYRQWFIATTCITDRQFKNSHLSVVKSIQINVIRIVNQLNFYTIKNIDTSIDN